MHKANLQLDRARRLLRVGFGLTAIVAGADKFLNVLTDWTMYLSPVAEALSPVSAQASMHLAGIVEVLVGVALLTPLVQQYAVELPGVLLLFSLLAFGILFGTLGIFLAAPLTVVTYVLVKRLYVIEALHTPTRIPGQKAD